MTYAVPRTLTLANALAARAQLVDMPSPDEPGVRIVGFTYLDAQATMIEAMSAVEIIRDVYCKEAGLVKSRQK